MKQIENYKPRIREKCRFCKCYLPNGCVNDICLKCSKRVCDGRRIGMWKSILE